jgi:hypothetical protein
MHIQQTQIFAQIKSLGTTRRVNNQIEGHAVRLIPVFVGCGNETIGAHSLCISLFEVSARYGPRFCAKRLREHKSEMSDSTHAYNADFLAWTASVTDEGAVCCKTGAEHRGYFVGH